MTCGDESLHIIPLLGELHCAYMQSDGFARCAVCPPLLSGPTRMTKTIVWRISKPVNGLVFSLYRKIEADGRFVCKAVYTILALNVEAVWA